MEIKFYGAFVLNRRVDLHAIDATPARWRGDAGSSPLDGARTAAPSPRNDLVTNYRCTRRTGRFPHRSHLQKCVRRGNVDLAVRSAHELAGITYAPALREGAFAAASVA